LAVSLRLARHGSNKRPFYRIVAADSAMPRDGRFIEVVGFYHPLKTEGAVNIDKERAQYWINKGARLSNTVKNLLDKEGIVK